MQKNLHHSGRTTRLLDDARRLTNEGRAVYIIVANQAEVDRFNALLGDQRSVIKVETPYTVGNFDWFQIRLLGAHPNCVVLVDHHAIESRFSNVLEMLHRYDK